MEKKSDRHSNDETRSQGSIGRRSVGTANTARSAMDLDQALTQLYREFGTETQHEDLAATLYEAGLANYLEKNYQKAPDHLTLALNMYRDLQAESEEDEEPYESEIADILKILGMVYLARQENYKALQNYEKANKERGKARNHLQQALNKKRKIHGETINTDIAELERYLGLTYLTDTSSTAETELAITHLANALRHFKLIYGEDTDHVEIADTYWHLGCAYQQQKDYEQARAQFTAALGMFQEVFSDPNHVKIAEAFYKIGFTYLAVGNHGKAISSFTKALEIYTEIRRANPTIDLNYVELCFHLGKTYFVLDDFESANPHLENAWLMYQALYRSSNPNHPSLQAADAAMTENKRKRAEKSEAEHMPHGGSAREEKSLGQALQTTTLSVVASSVSSLKSAAKQPYNAASVPTQIDRKIEEPSHTGYVQHDATRSEEKRPGEVAQALKLSGVAVAEDKLQQGLTTMDSHPESKQERPPSSLLSSKLGVFASAAPALAPTNSKKAPTVREIKAYYLSKAGFFNASKSIFVTENLEETIQALKARAGKGKPGASDDTLAHFGLN